MIVERIAVQAKPGRRDQVLETLRAERLRMDDPNRMRILTPSMGAPWNTVVYELTSENLVESEKAWERWIARPETCEFMQNWHQLVDDKCQSTPVNVPLVYAKTDPPLYGQSVPGVYGQDAPSLYGQNAPPGTRDETRQEGIGQLDIMQTSQLNLPVGIGQKPSSLYRSTEPKQ